ncbi:MAG: response regulator [Deinococcota bacterium]|jgi:CheY-like chemotaxis protein|nr:response regulator [Deinococcota bacterium]
MRAKILVVDDQAEVRMLVRMTLELGDYAILEADTGLRALELIELERPQVVVLDIMMPGDFDGYGVCREIRSRPEHASTFVCLLTARGQQADIEQGKEAGADAYLIKPFSPAELISLVEKATAGREVAKG